MPTKAVSASARCTFRGRPRLLLRRGLPPSGCPWGSETQIRSRGSSVVFVDQAAEQVLSAAVSRAHSQGGLVIGPRCGEGESAMGPPAIVVLGISQERPIEMPPTEDDGPVGAVRPDGRDDSLNQPRPSESGGCWVRALSGLPCASYRAPAWRSRL